MLSSADGRTLGLAMGAMTTKLVELESTVDSISAKPANGTVLNILNEECGQILQQTINYVLQVGKRMNESQKLPDKRSHDNNTQDDGTESLILEAKIQSGIVALVELRKRLEAAAEEGRAWMSYGHNNSTVSPEAPPTDVTQNAVQASEIGQDPPVLNLAKRFNLFTLAKFSDPSTELYRYAQEGDEAGVRYMIKKGG